MMGLVASLAKPPNNQRLRVIIMVGVDLLIPAPLAGLGGKKAGRHSVADFHVRRRLLRVARPIHTLGLSVWRRAGAPIWILLAPLVPICRGY